MEKHSKDFPIDAVLSLVTGRLMGEIGGVYEVLNWMTGDSVYTHQLPRIGKEAKPVILRSCPQLSLACEEAEQVNSDNWRTWLAAWQERYGLTIAVPKFTIAEHERIDPISELAERMHPSRIVVVQGGGRNG